LFSVKGNAQSGNEISVDLAEGKKKHDLEYTLSEFKEISKLVVLNSTHRLHRWQVTIIDGKSKKVESQLAKGNPEVPVTHQKHLKKKGSMIFELFYLNEKTKLEIVYCTVTVHLK
jgi:hypothetical protein